MMRSRSILSAMVLFLASGLCLTAVPAVAAADEVTGTSLERADELLQAGQWKKAAAAYEAVVDRDPSNGAAWFGLGRARHGLKQYDAAAAAYEKALEAGAAPPRPQYNLARANARRGEHDQAFVWLDRAVAAGFSSIVLLESDADLAGLRDDPRFEPIAAKVEKNGRPCKYDEPNRRFDFWIGDWEVRTPRGQKAGTNSIQSLLDGCLLLENWTSGSGGSGKSMNYYDPERKKWTQLRVDSSGGVISLAGDFRDGAMRFEGEHVLRSGKKALSRMSLTPLPNGHVHQFIEESEDGGVTWSVWFEGDYAPGG